MLDDRACEPLELPGLDLHGMEAWRVQWRNGTWFARFTLDGHKLETTLAGLQGDVAQFSVDAVRNTFRVLYG